MVVIRHNFLTLKRLSVPTVLVYGFCTDWTVNCAVDAITSHVNTLAAVWCYEKATRTNMRIAANVDLA